MDKLEMLEKKLEGTSEKERLEILDQLFFANININPEKSLEYTFEALSVAEDINSEFGIHRNLVNLAKIYMRKFNDYEKAESYFQKAIEFSNRIDNKRFLGISFNEIGLFWSFKGDFRKSLEFADKAEKTNLDSGNEDSLGTTYMLVASNYSSLGQIDSALENNFKALKVVEKYQDEMRIAEVWNSIGINYGTLGELEKALEYFAKCMEYFTKIDRNLQISVILMNMSNLCDLHKDYDNQLKYALRAKQIAEKLGEKDIHANAIGSVVRSYQNLNNLDKALEMAQVSLELAYESRSKKSILRALIAQGRIHNRMGLYEIANKTLEKGIIIAKEIGMKDLEQEIYQEQADIYEKMNDFESALKYHKKNSEIRDELMNEEKTKIIAEMQTRFETEKKEKEAEIFRLKNVELAEAIEKLEKTQNQLVEMAREAGMAQIASNVLHNVGNVLTTSITLSSSIAKMTKSSRPVQSFRKFIEMIKPHEENFGDYCLNDPKGKKIPGYLISLEKSFSDIQNQISEKQQNLKQSLNHISEIVSLQEKLSGKAGVQEKISIGELISDTLSLTDVSFRNHLIKVELDIANNDQIITLDKHRFLQILLNLLNNARDSLKQIDSTNRLITIRANLRNDSRFLVEICDNGLGIMSSNLEKIFSYGFTTKAEGHGYGLHGSANLATEMGGSLKAFSDGLGEGAEFVIEVPVTFERK